MLKGLSRLSARSVLLPAAKMSTGHPHPSKPPTKGSAFGIRKLLKKFDQNFSFLFTIFNSFKKPEK